jgi:hypothetical protein
MSHPLSFASKKWFGIAFALLIVLLVGISQTRAQTGAAPSSACPSGTKLSGWAWSSTIGWISFSSDNPTGGGGPHCVAIDSAGNLVGWAWSSNIGWIRFGAPLLSGFPTGGGASTAGNAHVDNSTNPPQIVGWARACAGTTSGNCSSMTSRTDGWDGWIEIGNTTHPMVYSGNSISGYAWGGEVVGWMQFLVSTSQTISSTASCTITATKQTASTYEINWNSANTNYCSAFSNNFTVNGTSGKTTVTPPGGANTLYQLSCTPSQTGGSNASCSTNVDLTGGGGGPGCTVNCGGSTTGTITPNVPAIQMWLNNDQTEKQTTLTIKQGQPAKMNWKKNTTDNYDLCKAKVDSSFISDGSFDTTPHPYGSPYTIPSSMLTAGSHVFTMKCTKDSSDVDGKTYAGSLQLNIRVLDSTIEEH